jgi:hypothetical protein
VRRISALYSGAPPALTPVHNSLLPVDRSDADEKGFSALPVNKSGTLPSKNVTSLQPLHEVDRFAGFTVFNGALGAKNGRALDLPGESPREAVRETVKNGWKTVGIRDALKVLSSAPIIAWVRSPTYFGH